MAYQLVIRLGTNPHIKVVGGNPVGKKGSQEQAKESGKRLALLGVTQEHQAIQLINTPSEPTLTTTSCLMS